MSETSFHFRQFTVHQEKCAMKVGTDSVLFGSWIEPGNAIRILDIGTGTGILALMLAQKSTAMIHGVDIDQHAFEQSNENFKISPWFNQLQSIHTSIQQFAEKTPEAHYDLIVSNPPYFQQASKPSEESRLNARHSDSLSFDALISGVKKLLHPAGRFCIILPCKEGMEFMDKANRHGLFCRELVRVKTKTDRHEKRLIMEFTFSIKPLNEREIIIQNEDGSFTEDYIELTKEYYIQLRPATSPLP